MEPENILEMIRQMLEKRKKQIEQKQEKTQILKISYLGKIPWQEEQNQEKILTQKDIYLILEQSLDEYNRPIHIEKYYTQDLDCIAGNNLEDEFPFPVLEKDYMNQSELLEKLQELEKKKEIDLELAQRKVRQDIARVLKKQEEEIKQIQELDIKHPIALGDTTSKDTMKGINIKEETNLNEEMKGKTLENLLGLSKIGINNGMKLARVTTTSLNPNLKQKQTTQDSFVVICTDGKVVPLGQDILKTDYQLGNNPREERLNANIDGKVNQEKITSSFLIVNGNGRQYLQVGYDEQAGKEIKYTMRSNEKGEDVSIELPTQRTYYQDNQMLQFRKDRGAGTKEAKEMIIRNEQHGECGNKDITNIDLDKNNDRHLIIGEKYLELENGKKISFAQLATQWGFFKEGKPDADYVKEIIKKEMTKNPNQKREKILEELEEQFEDPRIKQNR